MAKEKKPEAPPLSPELRAVLERHDIIEPATTPDLASLIGAVRRMGGSLTIRSLGDLGYAATVEMDGGSFDAGDDHPALAVAQAFAQALTATFPTQSGLFDDERPAHRAARELVAMCASVGGGR
jgi:hypothetical protein